MLYEQERFVKVGNGGFFDWGAYGDSPDGLVLADGCVEINSVIASTHYATMLRGSFDPAYRWQLIGHLDCTERQWCDFVSYCSDFPEDTQLELWNLTDSHYTDRLAQMIVNLGGKRVLWCG
jgi:hypothetical protein